MTLREKVFARDGGVCAKCGLNTVELRPAIEDEAARLLPCHTEDGPSDAVAEFFMRLVWCCDNVGLTQNNVLGRVSWEADHIDERVQGGKDELDNMQTLCWPCHKAKTAELVKLRAKGNRLMPKREKRVYSRKD